MYIDIIRHPSTNPARYSEMLEFAYRYWHRLTPQYVVKHIKEKGSVKVREAVSRVSNPVIRKHTVPRNNVGFYRRRNTGEIIVSPYIAEATYQNYFDLDTPRVQGRKVIYSSGLRNNAGSRPLSFTTTDDYSKLSMSFNRLERDENRSYSNFFGYVIYEDATDEIGEFARPEYNFAPLRPTNQTLKTSLVTSTWADANSGDWDILTSLAEFRETVGFIQSVILRSVDVIKSIKRRKEILINYKAKDNISSAADYWLEYRYALSPLLMEIEDIISAADHLGKLYNKSISTEKEEITRTIKSGIWSGSMLYTVSHRVWIKRRYDPQGLIDALQATLMTNIGVTLWELTTLSFVIDWFINIGDVIAAFTSIPVHCQQAACYVRKVDGTGAVTASSLDTKTDCSLLESSYYRELVDSGDLGLVFHPYLSWKRMLDAFALAWGPTRKTLNHLRA